MPPTASQKTVKSIGLGIQLSPRQARLNGLTLAQNKVVARYGKY